MQLNKKIVVFFLLSILSLNAFAWFVPLLVNGARTVATMYRTATTAEKVSVGGSLAVHAGIAAITFGGDDNNSVEPKPFTVHLQPNVPLSVPPGWSAAQSGQQQPVPPSTIPLSVTYTYAGSSFGTSQEACTYAASQWSVNSNAGRPVIGTMAAPPSLNCNLQYQLASGSWSNTVTGIGTTSCPLGYGLSGSAPNQVCALVNAQVVMKPSDDRCELVVSNNTFQLDSRDPDCTNAKLIAEGIERLDNKVSITKPNQKQEITLNPNGSVNHKTTTNTSDGKTTIDERNIDSSGNVTGEKSTVHDGQGDLMNPIGNGTTPVSGTVKVDFPTDYNREATQQAVKGDTAAISQNTKDTADELKKQFESTPEETVDTSAHEFDDTKYGQIRGKEGDYTSVVSGLVGKLGIPSGGQCSNASINTVMFGVSTSWDFQPVCASIAPLINYLFWTLILIFVWREVGSLRGSA